MTLNLCKEQQKKQAIVTAVVPVCFRARALGLFKGRQTLTHFPAAASSPRCTGVRPIYRRLIQRRGWECGRAWSCAAIGRGLLIFRNGHSNHFSVETFSLSEKRAHTPRARARTPPQRAQRTSSCSTASGLPRQRPSRGSAWARVKVWGGGFARWQYV